MDTERWRQVEEIFLAAVDLDREARAKVLDETCRDDPALRNEVEELLASDSEATQTIESMVASSAHHLASASPMVGRRIGRYELMRELGRGGMGAVYLARRADREFERQVALKLIQPGLDSGDIVRRFRRERQILAGLEHPAIAKLLDGGTSDDGLPYFVMEYVEGLPIDRYCDQEGLDLKARLALFRKVCAAVIHAHQNLVVHRDLKPGNILVRSVGGPSLGEVKLLDFGIARLLGSETDATAPAIGPTGLVTTRPLMTPAYASPEQVRGEPVGTASDVYSLGVILYRLLAGLRPYDLTGQTAAEIERIVCDQEPARPSEALRERAPEAALAAFGGVSATHLVRQLAGDLDNIVLQALRKERQRRYGSVEQLYDDIGRYLDGLPVAARTSTFTYRAGKFVQRNRWPLAAALALVALLVGLGVSTALQSVRVTRERDKAQQVADFLVDLFAFSSPGVVRRSTTSQQQSLDQRSAAIVAELQAQPEVQTTLLGTMGRVYQRRGYYDRAAEILRQALEIGRRTRGDDLVVAQTATDLADVLLDQAKLAEAQVLLEQSLAVRRRILGDDDPKVAESLSSLAEVLEQQGEFEAARERSEEVVRLRRRLLGDDDPLIAESLNDLALVLQEMAAYDQAEPLLDEALEIYRRQFGEEHPAVAMVLGNLGLLLHDRGEYDRAEPMLRRALALDRRLSGDDHPDVAQDLDNLAALLEVRGAGEEAEAAYRQALEIRQQRLGANHPKVAESLNNLAGLKHAQGEDATPFFRQALDILRRNYGTAHPDLATTLNNLGVVLQVRGEYDEAEPFLAEALEMRRQVLEPDHPELANSIGNLATLYHSRGLYAQAEPLYRQALDLWRRSLGADDPAVAANLRRLGELHLERRDLEAAEADLTAALEIQQQVLGERHPQVVRTLGGLAEVARLRSDSVLAEQLFGETLDMARAVLSPDHPNLATPLIGLGRLRLSSGRAQAAETLLRQGLEIRQAVLRPGHWRIAKAQSLLGECLTVQGRYAPAEALLLAGYEALEPGSRLRLTDEARQRLMDLYQKWGKQHLAQRYRSG
ncbi:MAG: serine/threonine-protein kinase [Acidobacteriota bacterium]